MTPQKEAFITVRRTEGGRFLMRSPFIPELFAEGEGPVQAIERLTVVLSSVLLEYRNRHREIIIGGDSTVRSSATELVGVYPFVEVRSQSRERFLLTSPVLPQLFAEGKGAYESVTRLTGALKAVLGLYRVNDMQIRMP